MSSKNENSLEISVTAGELPELIQWAHSVDRPLMIHGSPGLGKSVGCHAGAVLQAEGKKVVQLGEVGPDPTNEFGLFDIRLSTMGLEEFGLPSADLETGVQRRLPVDWFPSTDRDDLPEFGILLFEEVVSASPAIQAATYQITNDKRLGDKKMKPGWRMVLTGNRLTDGGVVNKMPTPLANRLLHVYVRSSLDSWTTWAIANKIPTELIAFLRFREDLLNTFEKHVKDRSKNHAFATERSWEFVSKLISVGNGSPPMALLAGAVGQGPATEFLAFRKVWKSMPSIDGILLDPTNAKVPEDSATRYAVVTALASRAGGGTMAAIAQYLERLPPELAVLTIKDAGSRHGSEVTATAAYLKLAAKLGPYLY